MSDAVAITDAFRIYQTDDGDAPALQGVSLTVAEGELVAIVGRSGSGKSTLLRIIGGEEHPDAGHATVLGREPRRMTPGELASFRSQKLGLVDQEARRTVSPDASACDAVALQLELLGARRKDAVARAVQLLERVGLGPFRERRVGSLSGGQRQRVAIAAGVAHRPRLLLFDEPTGELDTTSAVEATALIAELVREEGATAVLVSHDPGIGAVADRVLTLADGRLAAEHDVTGSSLVVSMSGWVQLPDTVRRDGGVGGRAAVSASRSGILLRGDPSETGDEPGDPKADAPRPASGEIVARLNAVTVSYGDSSPPALDAVTVAFGSGGLHVVTGPSGSGKTTLVNVLCGAIVPTAGICRVAGVDLGTLDEGSLADLRRRTIALVEQDIGLIPFLTARENIAFGLTLRGLETTAADDLIDLLGLGSRADQRVERLSAGERQRVALGRALAARPRLILVDEPTSRLDRAAADAVGELLAGAAAAGACVVCATHDPELIARADTRTAL